MRNEVAQEDKAAKVLNDFFFFFPFLNEDCSHHSKSDFWSPPSLGSSPER